MHPGKDIEGLIPGSISAKVFSENSDLVAQAMSAATEERKSAKNQLKVKLLEAVKQAPISEEAFKQFYALMRKIDKAFQVSTAKVLRQTPQ